MRYQGDLHNAFVESVEAAVSAANQLEMRAARPPLKLFTSTSPFARGMDIVRNRNCPACRSLRKFGADPVGLLRFLETGSDANRFRKVA